MDNSIRRKFSLLSIIFFLVILWGIVKGAVDISISELLFDKENLSILYLRLFRIWLAIMAGSGLSISGIALQAILRNPLAEPYLLGTSSGAGLGAVLAIIIGLPNSYTIGGFLGAGLSIILVYNLARYNNRISPESLILAGVIISIAFSGIIVFLVSMSGNEVLHGLMWWLWGSLQNFDVKLLFLVSFIVISGIFIIFIFSQDLDAISIGEEEAIHLGIRPETIKKILFFITSLVTASLVSICGIIGFVGLIIPHMMRSIVGPNHKILIPASCLCGASFMILCDMFSRTALTPVEIPIGIITAMIGSPIFIILFKIRQKEGF